MCAGHPSLVGRFLRKSVEKRWLRPEYNQRNLQYILVPRKCACLASVPVADEAAGRGASERWEATVPPKAERGMAV
eukprot:scaffold126812_cov42-Phaeocystis_antarctica.AAC.1